MCLCTSLYLYYCFVLHLLCFCDVFFVLTLNRDWRSARRLSRLGLCFHSQSFCARSLLSRVLSYLTVGARVTFSICAIDIFSSKLVMGQAKLNAHMSLAWWLPPSTTPYFIFWGGIQLAAETWGGLNWWLLLGSRTMISSLRERP